MKKSFLFITIILLSLFTFLKVNALVKPTSEFYVNDYANVLSEETEKYIMDNSVKLQEETKAQIVVVTVKSLEGKEIEEYATALFREFGIGDEKENNGLLILLAPNERDVRVEVGYGLEGVITDGLAGRYLDNYFIPYLKDNKWDEGIKNGYSAFYKKLCEYYKIDASNIEVKNYVSKSNTNDDQFVDDSIINTTFYLSSITGIAYGIFTKKNKKKKAPNKIIPRIIVISIWLILAFILSRHFDIYLIFVYLFTSILLTICLNFITKFFIFLAENISTSSSSGGSSSHSRSYHSSSSSHSSRSSSHHGGGGSSGGGGASRHF